MRGFSVEWGWQKPWRHDFWWLHLSHARSKLGGGDVTFALLGLWVTVEIAP